MPQILAVTLVWLWNTRPASKAGLPQVNLKWRLLGPDFSPSQDYITEVIRWSHQVAPLHSDSGGCRSHSLIL